jgi:phage tail-like protein
MNANGQTFRLVDGGNAWRERGGTALDTDERRVALGSVARTGGFGEQAALAEELLQVVPMARDGLGGRAWWDATAGAICSLHRAYETPVEPAPVAKLFTPPEPPTDLALGFDGLIYVAMPSGVLARDVRDPGEVPAARRPVLPLPGFQPWRLAADPAGGAWVLARDGKLARVTGRLALPPLTEPIGQAPGVPPAEVTFSPADQTTGSLEIAAAPIKTGGGDVKDVLGSARAVAIALRPGGALTLLAWTPAGAVVKVIFDDATVVTGVLGEAEADHDLSGLTATGLSDDILSRTLRQPHSIAWLDERRFAVLAPGVAEAVVFAFDDEALRPLQPGELQTEFNRPPAGGDKTHVLRPCGAYFPLDVPAAGPFAHAVTDDIEYPVSATALRPLVALSVANYPTTAEGELREPLDSGAAGTAWHRLYVDALLPAETGFTIHAAASDSAAPPADHEFFPHHFGGLFTPGPQAAWVPAASELPGHAGFLSHPRERDRAGLFTVLLQRGGEAGRRTRTLTGRFLHLRLTLHGNGRATPCLHALRAWCPRYSYADQYLPELYREQTFGTAADGTAPATSEDFLGRLLANFEGMLTPLEDSIAAAWRLTDPRLTPDEALPWLAQWIGVSFEPWFPESRRRAWLRCAPDLFKQRGTLGGLRLALEIATNGGVSAGRVVVLEDFRMRRTFGTLLGVSLDRDYDELLGGPVVSGNSKLGRSLILSDGIRRELFALFDAGMLRKSRDRRAVDEFFARLAWSVTVLVHERHDDREMALIRSIARQESPAHVVTRVKTATGPLIVGLSSLLGVDTYFRPPPPPETVTVGGSTLGGGALLRRPVSLYPRYA